MDIDLLTMKVTVFYANAFFCHVHVIYQQEHLCIIVYNCNQFNGEYSCWFCLQRGETYKHETGGISHIYPYDEANPKGPPRSRETINRDVQSAVVIIFKNDSKCTVNGHEEKFWFMYLTYFDPVKVVLSTPCMVFVWLLINNCFLYGLIRKTNQKIFHSFI